MPNIKCHKGVFSSYHTILGENKFIINMGAWYTVFGDETYCCTSPAQINTTEFICGTTACLAGAVAAVLDPSSGKAARAICIANIYLGYDEFSYSNTIKVPGEVSSLLYVMDAIFYGERVYSYHQKEEISRQSDITKESVISLLNHLVTLDSWSDCEEYLQDLDPNYRP